jgi:dihydrofolate reductase
MSTIYYTASTLDGFLAAADDDISFLDRVPQPSEDTYTPFIERVGAVAMGRATYEFVLRHVDAGNAWPYPQHPVWVFTHRDMLVPVGADARSVRGDVAPVHAEMVTAAQQSGKPDLWIAGGGDLAAQFYDAGLLDELVITVASWTLGTGKPLLPRSLGRPLELMSVRALSTGFAELRYKVPTA